MKNIIKILIALILMLLGAYSHAKESIKIAIIDNFKYQKYVTTKYKDYYLEGLNVARDQAKSNGLLINYKIFQYSEEPLSIINIMPKVIEWKPDVIIGPRDSNKFLMLSPYIKDVLTVSPFATSLAINKMPKNFFSITLSDAFEARAIYNFINWKFPEKDVIVLTEADCKSCNDVSEEFIKIWLKNKHPKPYQQYYISQQASTLKVGDAIKNNNGRKIIIIPNNAHDSAVLIARISQFSTKETIFIGGDGWGSWKDTEVGKLGNLVNYSAYHIVPWGLEVCTKNAKKFKESYEQKFKEKPKNKLSYIVYQTAMSIISSYVQYGRTLKGITKDNLLQGYKLALTKNKYWHNPVNYLVYKIHSNQNATYALVNPITNHSYIYNCEQQ